MINKKAFSGTIIILIIVFVIILIGMTIRDYEPKIAKIEFKEKWENSNIWEKASTTVKEIIPESLKSPLGFKESKGFKRYFFIGLLAGLWIYIIQLIYNLIFKVEGEAISIKNFISFNTKRDDLIFKENKIRWMGLVAGKLWKIFIIGLGIGILVQIPIINKVIDIITLEFLVSSERIYIKSFIFAFYIGFLPSIVEAIAKKRIEWKYEKKVAKVTRATKLAEIRGENS
tara:strand:+ start:2032 stop:2718 length:687 start_codon:yes stop_codon:yes gene_type:complete